MVHETLPRVVAFGGGAGLRRTLGGLSTALRQSVAVEERERLTAVVSVTEPGIDAGVSAGQAAKIAARLLPATVDDVALEAEIDDDGPRRRLRVAGRARPVPELLMRIINADVIVVGPGSLYTSILPALLVGGVAATVSGINAVRIYVANLTTEPGDTDGFTVADCLDVIRDHARASLFDYVLVNRSPIDRATVATYHASGALPMAVGPVDERELTVVEEDMAAREEPGPACHAPDALARAILRLAHRGRPRVGLRAVPGIVHNEAKAYQATAERGASLCYERMITSGTSFWAAVHEPFIRRDLTRDAVRAVVRRGLERTTGSYRLLAQLFNLPPSDYERFLTFLQKYDCDVPFRHSA